MKRIDTSKLTKDIHFPINSAVYKEPPKRNFFQKLWRFVTYKRNYEVMDDYVLWIPKLKRFLFVPCHFLYDNASVPKILSSLYNADGMLLLGSLPHDFGYRYQCLLFVCQGSGNLYIKTFTKKELDEIFRYLCAYESKFKRASRVAKLGLSLGGFFGWKSNRKKNCNLFNDFPELYV